MQPIIVWIQNDLRTHDNPALFYAREKSRKVIPVYILDESLGAASRAWLEKSLFSFSERLQAHGLNLILRKGEPKDVLLAILKESGAKEVVWNRSYRPDEPQIGKSFPGNYLFEPESVKTKEGKPFQVFTPFYKAVLFQEILPPLPSIPKGGETPIISSLKLEELSLGPTIPWDKNFWSRWEPGEKGAWKALEIFLKGPIETYNESRDIPSLEHGVSHLSPFLHFGEISVRSLAFEVKKRAKHIDPFLRQLIWREFAHHLLYHFPKTIDHPLRENFKNFPWEPNEKLQKAWQKGLTGYPIVDAGMRELYQTGWMHNRVRMIVGSFLVKDLLQSWQEGAAWFWDTLVDADLANNIFGWQWVAGCGADAAPYFRIFNPVLQSQKFDPEGAYIKRYCKELKDLSGKDIHQPWKVNDLELRMAGVRLGKNYPYPLVDHAASKERALAAFEKTKSKNYQT